MLDAANGGLPASRSLQCGPQAVDISPSVQALHITTGLFGDMKAAVPMIAPDSVMPVFRRWRRGPGQSP